MLIGASLLPWLPCWGVGGPERYFHERPFVERPARFVLPCVAGVSFFIRSAFMTRLWFASYRSLRWILWHDEASHEATYYMWARWHSTSSRQQNMRYHVPSMQRKKYIYTYIYIHICIVSYSQEGDSIKRRTLLISCHGSFCIFSSGALHHFCPLGTSPVLNQRHIQLRGACM